MKPVQFIMLSLLSFGVSSAWSQVQSGQLAYGGTGCPEGTAEFSRNMLLMDVFTVETSSARSLDRKTCSLTLPVQVSAGYQVGVVMPKLDISTDLVSSNSSVQLNAEIFVAGSTGPKLKKKLVGPRSADLTLQTKEKISWAACGTSVNLRMNISAVLQSENGEGSAVQINAIHRNPGSLFLYRKCRQ